ncbi:winged helix-turn-helix domain-containing protein [Aeromonas veronii]|uniref:winged helix-turn-helix domain-containing protein n=1 Tax=Aeromonas veronii TaxID=654 RepID=UPI003BA2F417
MLQLDVVSGELTWHGKQLARLSRSETLLLEHFITHAELLLSQDNLLDAGWPQTIVAPNTLVVAIKNIRKHISKTKASIETIHRRGYIFHTGDCTVCVINTMSNPVNAETVMSSPGTLGLHHHKNINEDYNPHINTLEDTKKDSVIETEHLESFKNKSRILFQSFSLKLRRGVFYIVLAVTIIGCLTIRSLKHEWFCYRLDNANVCGIFKLSDSQISIIKNEINNSDGDFLYGYENDFTTIKIYKIY